MEPASAIPPPSPHHIRPHWLWLAVLSAVVTGSLAWAALQVRQAREDAATLRGELADCSQRLRAAEVYKAPVIAAPVESPELQALKAEISAMAGEVKSIQERAREKEEGLQSLISFKQGELDTANRTVLELQSKVAELTAAAEAKPAPKRKR